MNDEEDKNFLANSHKRTKIISNRYFKEERISLPQLKPSCKIDNQNPFGLRHGSCVKAPVENGFAQDSDNGVNVQSSRLYPQKLSHHYYHQPTEFSERPSVSRIADSVGSPNISSKFRTRNFSGTHNTEELLKKEALQGNRVERNNSSVMQRELKEFRLQSCEETDRDVGRLKKPNASNQIEDVRQNISRVFIQNPREERYEVPMTPNFAKRMR